MIYLDNAATTPIRPEVLEAMMPYLTEKYGNPSSIYTLGHESKRAIETARAQVASLINADPEEIIFTSGGSESDNWALNAAVSYISDTTKIYPVLITSNIEHPAILNTAKNLDSKLKLSALKTAEASSFGIISPDTVAHKCSPVRGNIISIMAVNNEIGTIQPIKEIVAQSKSINQNTIIHTDAVQAVGHTGIDVKDLGVDMLSASGHKFNSPKGVGFLYIKKELLPSIIPYILGGGQERGLRAGTENVASIVGMGKAAEIAKANSEEEYKHLLTLSHILFTKLLLIPGTHINGANDVGVDRSPNNVNIRFDGVSAEAVLGILNEHGFCASAGSACHSNNPSPSHVLKAIGLSDEEASSSLRFSLGYQNTVEEIDSLIDILNIIINTLRR